MVGEEGGDSDDLDATHVPAQIVADDVLGVSLTLPGDWVVEPDPVLFDSYGFMISKAPQSEEASDCSEAVARVALAHQAVASDLEELVASKMEEYADVNPERIDLELADGRAAVAITGLPGTEPYSVVYTTEGDRVYEIGMWSDELGLPQEGLGLLDAVRFEEPVRSVESLQLPLATDALYTDPPAELATASLEAAEERAALFDLAAAEDAELQRAADPDVTEDPPLEEDDIGSLAARCGFTAPRRLPWQTQWDRTNRFYSGAYYRLRPRAGWSAMSGNGGSWWGRGYHVRRCSHYFTSQHFANDWPTQRGANAYAAFSGRVEYAGWGRDGFATLGRYVVVRRGGYRSLTAHLSGIARGVRWGARINAYKKVIGYAGSSGGRWAPHLHARVSYNERLTWNGQPYGGHSVRPRRIRCFSCSNYDRNAAGAGGFYTRFRYGRWMRY